MSEVGMKADVFPGRGGSPDLVSNRIKNGPVQDDGLSIDEFKHFLMRRGVGEERIMALGRDVPALFEIFTSWREGSKLPEGRQRIFRWTEALTVVERRFGETGADDFFGRNRDIVDIIKRL